MPLCKTYYVNAETGRDSFDTWQIHRFCRPARAVNRLTLQRRPERLACGSVFAGQYLHLTCGGKGPPCGRLRRQPCPAH